MSERRDKRPWYSPSRLLRSAYFRRLRPLLPDAAPIQFAGIPGPTNRKWGDRAFGQWLEPGLGADQLDYEEALVVGLRRHVRTGDRVVVVGGGYGITAVIAAQLTGPSGRVICYEGNVAGLGDIHRTAERNAVGNRLEVRCAIVGSAVHVYGSNNSTDIVRAEELPECDVLELDCEGAELGIIQRMTIRPRAIIVETHGIFGTPSNDVRAALVSNSYAVTNLGWAEPRMLEMCMRDDIRVLAATRID